MYRIARLLIILLFLILGNFVNAQIHGCTDPRANNYNVVAVINDGSCSYKKTNAKPREVIAELPAILIENSGIASINGLLWFHNDSGGEPEIYGLDTVSNQVVATLRLSNATNFDWEDISQDSLFVYVGDIGNNSGTRTDLRIYKIDKSLFPDTGFVSINSETIKFSYPDQIDYTTRHNNHNFDCEAFMICKDSLYLFSKNWINEWTKVYRLPKTAGNYSAELVDSFNVKGLITAADYNAENKEIVLLGYQNYMPFFWLLFDYHEHDFFSGNKRRIDFPITFIGFQTEGVLLHYNKGLFISTEKNSLVTNKLLDVNSWSWTMPINTEIFEFDSTELIVYPNPSQGSFRVVLPKNTSSVINVQIIDSSGRIVFDVNYENPMIDNTIEIVTKNLTDVHYFIILKTDSKIYRKSIHLVN